MKTRVTATATLGLALLAAACGGGTDLQFQGVAVSFATRAPVTGSTSAAFRRAVALDDTVVSGSDTLIISSVEIMLREIELERQDVDDCDVDPEPAGCEEVEIGPVLVNLPLAPGAQQEFNIQAPAGIYVEIEFDMHKLSSNEAGQFPDFPVDQSTRVRGTFNGEPFEFVTDVNVEQELLLDPPLVLGGAGQTNVTIFVNLAAWFRGQTGALLDPRTADKSVIDNNIQTSMRAFEDQDGDGNEG